MDLIMSIIGTPLGYIMWACYKLVNNYGIAIILFTLVTKFILFPVAIKIQKNSIKMVQMRPMIEELKKQYPNKDDKEAFMDAQMELYKEEKYSPAAGCLPMLIQLPIIFGLIDVIYKPLKHLLHLPPETIKALESKALEILNLNDLGNTSQLKIIETVNNPTYHDSFYNFTTAGELKLESVIEKIQSIDLSFLGLDLSSVPSIMQPDFLLIIPVLSGLSALNLSILQNRGGNVLQAEQGKKSQIGMTVFLTAFSLYFAFLVPAGIGLYWIMSNVFTILQMYILNKIYDPAKYIDYDALERMKAEKEEQRKNRRRTNSDAGAASPRKREREDYKKFFKANDKQLVFYSEGSGFYKYFENVIEELLMHSSITIHYITSDPNDKIFNKDDSRIVPYYIGRNRLIPFMMKMDVDMVVMTMPDLQQMHIKRSLVRDDVEYVYMFHAPLSFIMTIRHGALDYYDTIFATGIHQTLEIRESEKLYNLKEKKIVECGYGVIDNMRKHYLENKDFYLNKDKKSIVIAPSWQPDNILDSCLDGLLDSILDKGWKITVRPHPEYIKRFPANMNRITEKYRTRFSEYFILETDFSSNETIYSADVLITDWSWIAYEYSLATKRPSLFINTEMKIANPNYDKLPLTPLNLSLRNQIGVQLEKDEVEQADRQIQTILQKTDEYEAIIDEIVDKYLFNLGRSGEAGAQYIIDRLEKKD